MNSIVTKTRRLLPSLCLHAVALQLCFKPVVSRHRFGFGRSPFSSHRFHSYVRTNAAFNSRFPNERWRSNAAWSAAGYWSRAVTRLSGGASMGLSMSSLENIDVEDSCKLRIIFVNDVYELDNWPRFLTAVEARRGKNTIVCLPGDFVAPSLLSTLDYGKAMIDCMNRCKVNYVCFGNHETDIGTEELRNRIRESNFVWINSNMPDLDLGESLPEYEIVHVQGGGQTRRVALLGLLSSDPGLYRPNSFGGAAIRSVTAEADRLQQHLYGAEGVDLVLPMTHQSIADDREFARHFSGKGTGDNGNAFPLVLAAHDHEEYREEAGGAMIFKTGMDAKNVGICDVIWRDASSKAVEVCAWLEPVAGFAADAELQAAVDGHKELLRELDSAPLFLCEGESVFAAPLTSRHNRVRQTNLGTKLVSSLRDALGSECCVLNAGNLRGDRDYPPDKRFFTYNDLKAEIVFDCEMVTLPLPGKVIDEAVRFSRRKSLLEPPEASGGYLQICDRITYDEATQRVTHIGGEALEAERAYSCGLLFMLLTGLDAVPALMAWKAAHPHLIPRDQCPEMGRPAKLLLVDYFSKAIYYQLGSFDRLDRDGKGFLSRQDILEGVERHFGRAAAQICVDNIMRTADTDGDGRVSRQELLRVHFANAWARRDMDANHDGVLQREEVAAFARRMLGAGADAGLVESVLAELGGGEQVSREAVEEWLRSKFDLRGVSVPGQTLERPEIKAVQDSLDPTPAAKA